MTGDLIPSTGSPSVAEELHAMGGDSRPREKTIRQYLDSNPQGDRCSRCGDFVPRVKGEACVCWRCTQFLSELETRDYWKHQAPVRTCPDCGGERRKGKQRCDFCAGKQRRNKTRERVRRQRRENLVLL